MTVETIPSNNTDQRISLDVAVYAIDSSLILDHTYSLPAGHTSESQDVENRVDHLVVSLDGGGRVIHEYDPGIDICERDGEDVQIMIESEGIRFVYSC